MSKVVLCFWFPAFFLALWDSIELNRLGWCCPGEWRYLLKTLLMWLCRLMIIGNDNRGGDGGGVQVGWHDTYGDDARGGDGGGGNGGWHGGRWGDRNGKVKICQGSKDFQGSESHQGSDNCQGSKSCQESKIVKEAKIVKEVKRSDGSWRFACGDVYPQAGCRLISTQAGLPSPECKA